MTQQEFILAILAAVLGSPMLYEGIKAFINWRRGRLSKVAALEAALNEAQEAIDDLEQRKRALRDAHRQETDELHDLRRELERENHRLQLRLMYYENNPDDDTT